MPEDPRSNSTSPTGSNPPDLSSVDRLALIGQLYDDFEHVWGEDAYAHEAKLMHLMVSIATVPYHATVDWTCDDALEDGVETIRQLKEFFLETYPDTHPVWKFITLREGPQPRTEEVVRRIEMVRGSTSRLECKQAAVDFYTGNRRFLPIDEEVANYWLHVSPPHYWLNGYVMTGEEWAHGYHFTTYYDSEEGIYWFALMRIEEVNAKLRLPQADVKCFHEGGQY